jgi:hypothetical protein
MRIPMSALSKTRPEIGTRWRIMLFRCDRSANAFLAWNPTLSATFHTPEKFGVFEFVGESR